MSTIVGIKTKDHVMIGADTRGTSPDGEISPSVCKKIFRNGPYLIAFIGSVRGGQILYPQYFKPPQDIGDFPDALRQQCENKGCLGSGDEIHISIHGCNFLIGFKKRLYEILIDFQLCEIDSYMSRGSGSSYALGSLHNTQELEKYIDLDTEARITLALEAASKFDASTSAPFDIITL